MKKTKWFVAALAACAMALFAAGCSNGSDDSGGTEPVAVDAIGLDPSSCSLNVGKEQKLTAIVKPDEAAGVKITWSSSKDEVATVGSDGTVKALKVGRAIITAQAGEKKAECEVTVITCSHYYDGGKCTECGLQKPVIDGGTIDASGQLTKYTGKETKLVIPDGVTRIGGSAFSGCTSLTSVTIPDDVTGIGSYAFKGCTGLASVTIPASVTGIEFSAFEGYTSLKEVTIPDGVTAIGSSTFKGCTSLASVTIPDGVTKIEFSAFEGCTSLESVTIPDGVTGIGSYAFKGCTSLTEIQFTGTTAQWKEIEGSDGVNITRIRCSNGNVGVEEVPEYLTMNGTIVTGYTGELPADLTIPDGVTAIDKEAFENCKTLTSVKIPDSVTYIGSSAFYGCSNLTSVTIPDSVTSIGYDAFNGCSNLTSVTIPDSVTYIGSSAFSGCTSLTTVNYAGTKAQWEKIEGISGAYLSDKTIVCTDGEVTVE